MSHLYPHHIGASSKKGKKNYVLILNDILRQKKARQKVT